MKTHPVKTHVLSKSVRSALTALTFAVLTSLVAIPSASAVPAGYTLVWADEFTSTSIDTTHWLVNDSCISDYTPASDAAKVANGYLTQTIYTNSGKHYTTQLDTRFKYQPKYGYMEASIRTVNSSGNWWAFWTWIDSIVGAAPLRPHTDGVEMDIMEHRAIDAAGTNISNQIPSTLHWDGYDTNHKAQSSGLRGAGLATGFHLYALEWTPTSYNFSIDGTYLYTVTDSTATDPVPSAVPVSQISQFILLTGQIGGSWSGPILSNYGTLATSTTKMDVDYIRVYQKTPATPAAPVRVEVGPNSAGGWKLGWDLTDNAPHYNVKRATTAGGPYTTLVTTGRATTNDLGLISSAGASYVDTTAVAGTAYYYVISAVNGTVEGPNSLEVCTNAANRPAIAHTGTSVAKGVFNGSSADKNVQQTATVAPSTVYEAGVWVQGSGRMTLRVYNTSNSQVSSTQFVDAAPGWTYFKTSTFSTGGNTLLKVKLDDSSPLAGATNADDFFLGPPGGANVLVNPGFESGTTAWTLSSASPVWNIVNSGGAQNNVYGGYQAARGVFSGTTTYSRIEQTADVPVNTTYVAGAWIRGGGRTTLRVYNLSGVQISATLSISPTATWTYYVTAPFSTGSNTRVKLRIDDFSPTATSMYVDNVFLGVSGGANVLTNPDFERGSVAWDTSAAGTVWKIGQW